MSSYFPIIHALADAIEESIKDMPFTDDVEAKVLELKKQRINLDLKQPKGYKKSSNVRVSPLLHVAFRGGGNTKTTHTPFAPSENKSNAHAVCRSFLWQRKQSNACVPFATHSRGSENKTTRACHLPLTLVASETKQRTRAVCRSLL